MKKITLLLLVVLGAMNMSQAQTSYGVKSSVGVTLAPDEMTFSGEVFDYINHEVTYKGSNLVKSVGIFGQKKFGYLYGRAELSYTTYQQEYSVRSFVQFGQGTRSLYETFGFVDFQVMAGLTHKNLRFGVGPVAHILVQNEPVLDFISGSHFRSRPLTYGFTTAIGVDAGIFSIDVRYENNFRTVGDHIFYGNRDAGFKAKPHVVNLTLGVSI